MANPQRGEDQSELPSSAESAAPRCAAPATPQTRGSAARIPDSFASDLPKLSPWWGWLAAAAGLMVAILAWLPDHEPTLSEMRAHLIEEAQDEVVWSWTPGNDASTQSATGDVVWSNARQQGCMRFTGLPVNDPDLTQYQLWIIDPAQQHPIDGGVFDIASGTKDVIVPINPKLSVSEATAFAVTIEKPGGVVVSTQDQIAVMAKAGI